MHNLCLFSTERRISILQIISNEKRKVLWSLEMHSEILLKRLTASVLKKKGLEIVFFEEVFIYITHFIFTEDGSGDDQDSPKTDTSEEQAR